MSIEEIGKNGLEWNTKKCPISPRAMLFRRAAHELIPGGCDVGCIGVPIVEVDPVSQSE